MGKFHWKDRVYFERGDDGSVKVTLGGDFDGGGYELFTIDRNSWASIVASVSERGEADGRFYEALAFHGEPADAQPKNDAKDAWNARPAPAPDLREVLEEAAKIAESHAVCGCNGEQGTCLIDDTPKAIAAEIREYALSASPVSEGEMVERVARAIPNAALACGETGSRREWEGLTSDEREGFIRLARAAIAAMQSGKQGG